MRVRCATQQCNVRAHATLTPSRITKGGRYAPHHTDTHIYTCKEEEGDATHRVDAPDGRVLDVAPGPVRHYRTPRSLLLLMWSIDRPMDERSSGSACTCGMYHVCALSVAAVAGEGQDVHRDR